MKYVIVQVMRHSLKDKWHARIKSPNGKILFHSEEYSSFGACKKTINGILSFMRDKTYHIHIRDAHKPAKIQTGGRIE